MATLETFHDIRCRLSAEAVDSILGLIRGCTVMKADVQAAGKFVMLDAKGIITRDEEQCTKRIPVFTDAKTLDTLMAAAKVAGKRIKMREDHDDSVGARAGYVDGFKRVTDESGDRVATDLHVFRSYRNRAVMLETAAETPEEIGLSIDFRPTFELVGDKALMRVAELYAVDVVDEGAVTPDGLFLSARVDKRGKSEIAPSPATQPLEKMAAETSPNAELLAAIAAMGKTICDSVTSAMAKTAAPAPAADAEGLAALKAQNVQLAADLKTIAATAKTDAEKAVKDALGQFKKTQALLGFRGTDAEKATLAASSVEDIEKMNSEKKNYLQLVAEHAEKTKCKKSEAHLIVQKSHKAEYAAHLLGKGVFDPARANMRAA